MPRLPFNRSCLATGLMTISVSCFPSAHAWASGGCLADISNDHLVDMTDLLSLIDTWGPCSGSCSTDLNQNGEVDMEDLLWVINAWGPCLCLPEFGCLDGESLWCEDWELNNYSRWTGGYDSDSDCETTGFNGDESVTPIKSHKSTIICSTPDSHRGYGGLRFQGDTVVPNFSTPSSNGIVAPDGVVVTFWSWYSVPYTFTPTKWMSLMTVTHDCTNNWTGVVTLNLDDSTMRIKPVHVSSVTYAPNAPSMPENQWVRTTAYINYNTGSIHVWQNGVKVVSATFSRPETDLCQWHWGLYASGNNNDIVLYEEDLRIVKLLEPMTNFTDEPWFDGLRSPCDSPR